ncbi:MAG: hypothetical protein IIY87_02230, partial [Bacteroidales bacterium]|nr:hypothetical protein [Bacteroidales bacterium]
DKTDVTGLPVFFLESLFPAGRRLRKRLKRKDRSSRDRYRKLLDAQRALNIEPDNPIYLTTLALIYADSGDYENADLVFEKTIPLFSDFEQGWIAFADYQIVRGNFEAAIEGLTKGLPTCELVMEFNKRLALCYYMTGRRNMLFNAVRACIFDNPDGAKELLEYLPELEKDPEVMNIIASHINHNDYSI